MLFIFVRVKGKVDLCFFYNFMYFIVTMCLKLYMLFHETVTIFIALYSRTDSKLVISFTKELLYKDSWDFRKAGFLRLILDRI